MAARVRIRIEEDPEPTPKKQPHRFQKGQPRPEGAGRQKGVENKVKTLLKDALILAASNVGNAKTSLKHGTGGLVGYLERCAIVERVAYMRLLEKLLPYQITGKDGGPMQLQHSTKEELVLRLKERGLPLPPSLLPAPQAFPTFEEAQFTEIQKDQGDDDPD